jgi:hypothetical protein
MSQRTPICWIEEAEARHMVLCDAEAKKADRTAQQQSAAAERGVRLSRLLLSILPVRRIEHAC